MDRKLLKTPALAFKKLKEKSWGTIVVDDE
jgi:hypothetical protein